MTDLIDIHGVCAPGFEAVREAFAANFTDAPEGLDEQAARFSVVIEGEAVVDLWGGWADTAKTTPFTDATLTSVFSTGKAVMALLMATAVEAGQVDYDQTVASLWPAFGAAGKQDVTVAQLMSHQAGLPGFSEAVEPSIWFDAPAVLDRLAAQAPMWAPGTASAITRSRSAIWPMRSIAGRPGAPWARRCVRTSPIWTCGSACPRPNTGA